MNIFCKRKKQNLWKTFLFYTRVLYLNLYLHVYLNKIHIKNGKYVVFTMSWPDDAHPTWLKFYLKSVELKYLFFEDLWNNNTHTACLLDVQVSRFLKKSDTYAILSYSLLEVSSSLFFLSHCYIQWYMMT